MGFDYLGVNVTIISLVTAFAVGFQIWNALSLKKRLNELKAIIETIKKIKCLSMQNNL